MINHNFFYCIFELKAAVGENGVYSLYNYRLYVNHYLINL